MSDDRKRPSGFQQRKARREREAAERVAEAERAAHAGEALPSWLQDYVDCGEPPIGDAVAQSLWARDLVVKGMKRMSRDPTLTEEKRYRYILDGSNSLAKNNPSALVAERIANLEDQVYKGKGNPKPANDPKRAGSTVEPYEPEGKP